MTLLSPQLLTAQNRAGGPRHIQLLRSDGGFGDEPFDFGIGRGRPINFDSISTLPKPIPTPTQNALALGGGLTLAQLDRAARFETAEGVPIGLYYGKVLFALKLVSQLYEPGIPRNTFTGIIGEGWGGLGRHGEFHRIVAAYYLGELLTNRFNSTVWFDDRLPQGAVANNGQDGWNWIQVSPTPFSGFYAHQSPNIAGQHAHSFTGATQGLAIGTGDTISCWVWLDPTNTPTEIMLQFNIGGDGEHRAYWGANSIALGTNGTNSRRQISASVPATGQWVRLDVLASQVGLAGTTIDGMSFLCFGGSATWDQVSRWKNEMGGGNTGYVFRPGIIATHIDDIVQGLDFTDGDTWLSGTFCNGSAALTVRLSSAQSAQNRPDGFKCIAECRRTSNYDATGAEIVEDYDYSASPARAVADRFLFFFQRRFRERLDVARDRFRRRIFWPSWVNWRDNSAQLIPWDREGDGVNVFVPRAEFHGGWSSEVTMAQVLDEACGQSFTGWQDDGEQVIFLPPGQRAPVHHFHPGNIVAGGEPQRSTQPLSGTPNRVIIVGRDIEDEFLGEFRVEPPDDTQQHQLREDSISRVNEIRTERAVGGMTQSQGMRIAEFVARLAHDNPVRVSLVGNATAIHLLKWDLVTVSHPVLGWDHQLCLVLSATVRSPENSADEVEVNLQKIDGDLDVDGYHRPRQEALTL